MADPPGAPTPPEPPIPPATPVAATETGYWQPYAEFAKTLRTWFVGYGVGAPALVLTQQEVRRRLVDSGWMHPLGWLFLSGVFLQVILAFVYKTAMWQLYMGETDESRRDGRWYRWASEISEWAWPEFTVDLLTIALFIVATFIAFGAITEPTAPPSVQH
jgi:hypothetical protein